MCCAWVCSTAHPSFPFTLPLTVCAGDVELLPRNKASHRFTNELLLSLHPSPLYSPPFLQTACRVLCFHMLCTLRSC